MRHKRIHLISAYSQLHYGNMATISKKTFDLHLSDQEEKLQDNWDILISLVIFSLNTLFENCQEGYSI